MPTRDPILFPADDALRVAQRALEEDGLTDVTTSVLQNASSQRQAKVIYRSGGVFSGLAYADAVADLAGCSSTDWMAVEGQAVVPGYQLASMSGSLASILRAERPLLNILQRACGIASVTRSYVRAVGDTNCTILHTRKSPPGLRTLDVRAVLAGGGKRHRVGLDEELMFKDNHWAALRSEGQKLQDVLSEARRRGVPKLHVEVETAVQLMEACAAGATRLLIDNRDPGAFAELAAKARALQPDIEIEATGGITLQNVTAYAASGATFVSIGALTHSVQAADIALELVDGGS